MIAFSRTLELQVAPAPDMAVLYAVTRRHRLSTYDAAYLELAQRLKIPLATRD